MTKAINRKRRRAFRQAMASNRIEGAPRTPRGRISEAKGVRDELTRREMEANLGLVLDARKRMQGAKPENACDPRWESALGTMYLQGHINARQYEAGEFYRRVVERFRRAIQAPKMPGSNLGKLLVRDAATRTLESLAGTERTRVSMDDSEYVEWYQRSLEQHGEVRAMLNELTRSFSGRDAHRALNAVVLDEQVSEAWLGALRVALNEIHRRFIA